MTIAFRPAESTEDRKFVISTWLDSSRTDYSSGLCPMEDWYTLMWPAYDKLLRRTDMKTIVAYEQRDPSFLYGWIAADPTDQAVTNRDGSIRWWPALVLYVFVKQNFRGEGYARRLFAEVGVDPNKAFLYAGSMERTLQSKLPLAKFSPLTARFPKEKRA
jgi:hypothetical protein